MRVSKKCCSEWGWPHISRHLATTFCIARLASFNGKPVHVIVIHSKPQHQAIGFTAFRPLRQAGLQLSHRKYRRVEVHRSSPTRSVSPPGRMDPHPPDLCETLIILIPADGDSGKEDCLDHLWPAHDKSGLRRAYFYHPLGRASRWGSLINSDQVSSIVIILLVYDNVEDQAQRARLFSLDSVLTVLKAQGTKVTKITKVMKRKDIHSGNLQRRFSRFTLQCGHGPLCRSGKESSKYPDHGWILFFIWPCRLRRTLLPMTRERTLWLWANGLLKLF